MTPETHTKQLVFTDIPTFASHYAKLSNLSIVIDIISNREGEIFAKDLKESNEFLKNILKQL